MTWRTRKKGTSKQVGNKFMVGLGKKLPQRLSLAPPAQSAQRLADEMVTKPVTNIKYLPPTETHKGTISFFYDGSFVVNSIEMHKEKWVGTWDRYKNTVYEDPLIPDKYRKSLSIHESIEKYLKEKYGLSDNAEGHESSDIIERKEMLRAGQTEKDWSEYMKLVERVHRQRIDEEERAGGKTPLPHEIEPSPKAHFKVRQTSINWKKMQAEVYGKKARIVRMSPEEYLRQVPSLLDERSSALAQLKVTGEKYFAKSSLDYIQNQIEKGEEIGIPWIDHTDIFRGWPSHEGRHRALVAMKMGIKRIPVMVVR